MKYFGFRKLKGSFSKPAAEFAITKKFRLDLGLNLHDRIPLECVHLWVTAHIRAFPVLDLKLLHVPPHTTMVETKFDGIIVQIRSPTQSGIEHVCLCLIGPHVLIIFFLQIIIVVARTGSTATPLPLHKYVTKQATTT